MKTLIAIPCGDLCHTDFLRSLLGLEAVGEAQYTFAQGSLVYDARNRLAEAAINGGFDRVLWLDSDMIFPRDLMRRMHGHLDAGLQMITGVYSTRKPPIRPTLYSELTLTQAPGEKFATPGHKQITELPKEPFTVAGCGFGCVMVTVDLLRRVWETYGAGFTPASGFGEDLSFCLRVSDLGEKIWCDPGIVCGHVGMTVYYPEGGETT